MFQGGTMDCHTLGSKVTKNWWQWGGRAKKKTYADKPVSCTTAEKVSSVHIEFCALGIGVMSSNVLVNIQQSFFREKKKA